MKNNEMFYEMIFKRKSFHMFKDIGCIAPEELEAIEAYYQSVQTRWPITTGLISGFTYCF